MSGLFSKPKVTPPAPMPTDANDASVRAAEEAARRKIMGRSGRESTILSQGGASGAPKGQPNQAYKNTALGQA